MKSMRAWTTTALTGLVAWSCWQPQTAVAGDKEWATAGKILTGVAVLQLFHHGLDFRVERHPREVEARREPKRIDVRDRWSHPRYGHTAVHTCGSVCRCHREPRPAVHHVDYNVRLTRDAVYRDISDCRRVYQPRRRGHRAYVQTRPHASHPWVTAGEHPSIW